MGVQGPIILTFSVTPGAVPTGNNFGLLETGANAVDGRVWYRKSDGVYQELLSMPIVTPANDDFLQRKAGAWTNRTIAQVKTDLSLSGTNTGDQTTITGNAGTATTLQTGRTIAMSGDVVWNSGTFNGSANVTAAGTIQAGVVTNAKQATVATATIKGRVTAGTGNVEDLTGTQATTLLDLFTTSLKGLVPGSGGGTTNFLRADGTWAAPPGGGGSGDVVGPASATDNAIVRFDLTTGKLIQVSGITIADGASGTLSGTNTGDQTTITGNAGSATVLQTGRTIGITGDLVWTSPSFDGSGNVTAAGTIQAGVVTLAKMANLAQDQFIGRVTASTGVPETATITAAARSVLDDTTVAAMVDTLGGATSGGTGGLARLISPTFTTPALGTPTALVLTNATGLPLSTGVTGTLGHANLGTGGGGATKFLREDSTWQTIPGGGDALTTSSLAQFAATTSAQLLGVLSDETGTGLAVFNNTPTLSTPVLNGIPTGTGVATAATASTLALRDANGILTAVVMNDGYSTTATAAGTTTLTVASNATQFFTGSTTQNCDLPVTSTLTLGHSFVIDNNSTGIVTVRSSGANSILAMPGSSRAIFTCILTSGTTAASWSAKYDGFTAATGTGSVVRGTSPTLVTPVLGTPASGTLTNCTGLTVAGGGTGRATSSSFQLIAGGTTNTAAQQSVSVGNATDILQSGGVGTLPTWQASSGTGNVARVTSPTFVTPALGTPTALVLTNASGLPLTSGVTGILPVANGGTGMAFFTVAGPASTAKTFTFPNANATVLTDQAAVTVAQGGTGAATFTDGGVMIGNGTGALQVTSAGTAGYPLVSGGAGVDPSFSANAGIHPIQFSIGDGVNVITTALKDMVCVPYACKVIGYDLVSVDSDMLAVTGSIVLDLWKDTYANFPPTNADSITSSAKPTLTAASKTQQTSAPAWSTVDIAAGDYMVAEVESVTSCKRAILTHFVRKT